MSYLIGLTGGIGSGKSTVAHILGTLGAVVVDADAVSRGTTAVGGCAIAAIRQTFGTDFVNAEGAMDRGKMRELVFADRSAKAKLENIVHPLIQQGMQLQIEQAVQSGCELIVLDLPLLAERTGFSGWKSKLEAVWVVDCQESTQIRRVEARSGMTEAQIRAVMNHQASRVQRRAIADVVITNENIDLNALREVIMSALPRRYQIPLLSL